jgi:hypothetical protein
LGLDETFGGEALHRLDDLKVWDIKFLVLRRVIVFFGDENALCR